MPRGAFTQVSGPQSNCIVCDQRALAPAVAGHNRIAVAIGQRNRVECFGDGANLVDFEQDRVRCSHGDALDQALDVRSKEVVAYDLDAQLAGDDRVPFIVLFIQRVLDDHKGIVGHHFLVEPDQIVARLVLHREQAHKTILFLVIVGARGHVDLETDLPVVAAVGNGLDLQVPQFPVVPDDARRDHASPLVAVDVQVLSHQANELVRDLPGRIGCLGKALEPVADHRMARLATGPLPAAVAPAAQDGEHAGNRERAGVHAADVLVEGNAHRGCACLQDGGRYARRGIAAQPGLVGRTVELDDCLVDRELPAGVHTADRRADDIDHVVHGLEHTPPVPPRAPIVGKLYFMGAHRHAGGHYGNAFGTVLCLYGRLDARMSSIGIDLPCCD